MDSKTETLIPADQLARDNPIRLPNESVDYRAARHQRTLAPIGERRILIAPDLVGSSAEIAESLRSDPVLSEVTELQLELPYAFAPQEYEQILSDVAASIAPHLGWSPSDVGLPGDSPAAITE